MFLALLGCAPGPIPPAAPSSPAASSEAPHVDVDLPIAGEFAMVDCNGGADYTTIGDAIDAAASGDTIVVGPCTYEESIDFGGKAVRLQSSDGPESTIIQADGTTSVVYAGAGEADGTAIVGFTLTGGGGTQRAAIHVDFASLRLEDVVVTGNRGLAAVFSESADIEIAGSTFAGNRGSLDVVAWADRGSVLVTDSTFECGSDSFGVFFSHGAGYVDRSTFACEDGWSVGSIHAVGGIFRSALHGGYSGEQEFDHYDDFMVIENSYVEGVITQRYGAVWLRNSISLGGVDLEDTSSYTVIESSVLMEADCGVAIDSGQITVRNNLFWDVDDASCGFADPVGRDGNLGADPLFVDLAGGDWHLAGGSPGLDAGPTDDGYEDVDGTRNDLGVFGGPLNLDGGW